MIVVFTGQPGAGKSLKLARTVLELLRRNVAWSKNPKNPTGQTRLLYTNLKLMPWVMEEFGDYIREWTDTSQLVFLRDCDVVWDEMAAALDAHEWQSMSLELKRWLQQHRKYGIEIYGTAQDFAQVDKSARRLVSDLLWIRKLWGSRDISPTLPPPRWIYGICTVRALDPQKYNEATSKFDPEGNFPGFMFFVREDTEVFDTRAEVGLGEYPKLRHVVKVCENPHCDFSKISHL